MKIISLFSSLLISFSFLTQITFAQGGFKEIEITAPPFIEKNYYSMQANSSVIYGVQATAGFELVNENIISFFGLRETDRTICLVIESSTGFYVGRAAFEIPNGANHLIVHFPSKLIKGLQHSQRNLAIKAQVSAEKNKCNFNDPYIITAWGRVYNFNEVNILLNENRATYVDVRWQLGIKKKCSNLKDNSQIMIAYSRFNKLCEISAKDICGGGDEVEINSRDGSYVNEPIKVKIRGFCPSRQINSTM